MRELRAWTPYSLPSPTAICRTSCSTYVNPKPQSSVLTTRASPGNQHLPSPQTGSTALIHSLVTYTQPASRSLVQFQGADAPPHHPLLAHVYGVKNVYTAAVRLCAAYQCGAAAGGNAPLYDLAALTFAGVLWLYVTEWRAYGTVRAREAAVPLVTAGAGLLWMVLARGSYVQ